MAILIRSKRFIFIYYLVKARLCNNINFVYCFGVWVLYFLKTVIWMLFVEWENVKKVTNFVKECWLINTNYNIIFNSSSIKKFEYNYNTSIYSKRIRIWAKEWSRTTRGKARQICIRKFLTLSLSFRIFGWFWLRIVILVHVILDHIVAYIECLST